MCNMWNVLFSRVNLTQCESCFLAITANVSKKNVSIGINKIGTCTIQEKLGAIRKQDKMLLWPQMTYYLTTCRNIKICDYVHPLVTKTSGGNPILDNHSVYIVSPHINCDPPPSLPNTKSYSQ